MVDTNISYIVIGREIKGPEEKGLVDICTRIGEQGVRERAEMEEEMRKSNMTAYQKQIITYEPNTYAEVVLKFENLQEIRVLKLRELFNKFAAEVERMVLEDTSLYV